MATLLALLDPGDEIIIFEPFYENYGPGAIIAGAKPVFVPLRPFDFTFDPRPAGARLHAAHEGHRLQQPEQPNRQGVLALVSSRSSASSVRAARRDRDHGRDLRAHGLRRPPGTSRSPTFSGMADRTITISGVSKSYSVHRLAVGYTISSPELASRHPPGPRLRHGRRPGAPSRRHPSPRSTCPIPTTTALREAYQARRDLLRGQLEQGGVPDPLKPAEAPTTSSPSAPTSSSATACRTTRRSPCSSSRRWASRRCRARPSTRTRSSGARRSASASRRRTTCSWDAGQRLQASPARPVASRLARPPGAAGAPAAL